MLITVIWSLIGRGRGQGRGESVVGGFKEKERAQVFVLYSPVLAFAVCVLVLRAAVFAAVCVIALLLLLLLSNCCPRQWFRQQRSC